MADVIAKRASKILLQLILKNSIDYKSRAKEELIAAYGLTETQAVAAVDTAFNDIIEAYTGG